MIVIRPAVPDDVAAIAKIHIASWQAAYRGILDDATLARMDIARHAIGWQRALEQHQPILVAADDQLDEPHGDSVVGFASLRENEITVLYLAPDRWRQGIGRRLLGGCLEVVADAGYATAWLWVLEANAAARAFYAACGGQPAGEGRVKVGDQQLVQVRYLWRLAPAV